MITKRLTVVLCPPVEVASTDDIVEDEADQHREYEVKGSRRRHCAHATEGHWEIDVFEETRPELLLQYPLEQWCKDAGKKEEDETIVEPTV